jgi:hypothetical protein
VTKIKIDLTGDQAHVTTSRATAPDKREAARVKYRVPVIYDAPTRPALSCYGRYWPAVAPAGREGLRHEQF